MFENVAMKIQKASKIIWIVGTVVFSASALAAMIMLIGVFAQAVSSVAEVVLVVLGIMTGCLAGLTIVLLCLYFITLCINGFGRLIENTDKLTVDIDNEENDGEKFRNPRKEFKGFTE